MLRRLAPLALAIIACTGETTSRESAGGPSGETSGPPPGTDVWLAELRVDENGAPAGIGEARNVTERPGYDNQPYFLPDGTGFWYTSIDELGEADILRYDLAAGSTEAVTSTAPESEYSATPLPGGGGFSAIRVEADSTQRLWRFPLDGGEPSVILPEVAPVGYHAWADETTVVLFVLGAPPTLQVGDVESGEVQVVARDVGRSLQHVPGTRQVSYVQRLEGGGTEIRRLDPDTGESEVVAPGIEGGDFHAWTPSGVLLQAGRGVLHRWTPGAGWEPIADLGPMGIRLSRLAVSPDGTLIALVGEPDEEG